MPRGRERSRGGQTTTDPRRARSARQGGWVGVRSREVV
ncbi:hypothetical protein LC55x_5608 [Lysobacter capsici]|nr:hypothetical protein LC55x_5608 [Lysobacter capsici]